MVQLMSLSIHYYGGLGYYYFDPTYILIIIGVVISLIAQFRVKTTFSRYSNVYSQSRLTGAEVAKRILNSQGIYDVYVGRVEGSLTDHYNPKTKVLNLSDSVYGSSSVAAIGVAAHECGHAIQHNKGYSPLAIRAAIVPVVNIGTRLSWIFLVLGLILNNTAEYSLGGGAQLLFNIGLILFSFGLVFQLITLPVEFNASRRALTILKENQILYGKEVRQAGSVLRAAALTYVAAVVASLLQLVRLIIIFGGRRRD